MRVNDVGNWPVTEMRYHQLLPDNHRSVFGHQWVNHNPAGIATDNTHYRQVITANLPYPIHDFKKAVIHIQLGITP